MAGSSSRLVREAAVTVGVLVHPRTESFLPTHQDPRSDLSSEAPASGTGSGPTLAEIGAKLHQLEHALATDDEVEADAARLSARKAIKTVRVGAALSEPHRLLLGTVYDALTFTDATAMSASSVQVLRRCFDVILTGPIPGELAAVIRRDLDRAGFQLRPSPIE